MQRSIGCSQYLYDVYCPFNIHISDINHHGSRNNTTEILGIDQLKNLI